MARPLRHIPDGHLVEVTCRTTQRRYLLRPSEELNQTILGTIARGQKRYGVQICGFVYLSNHCHLLLRPKDAEQLASFMRYINSKIAREVGHLHGWKAKVWARRYSAIVVSQEPAAQIDRLRYLLEQGCKEGLVSSPQKWPGASTTKSLMTGVTLEGAWVDRTKQYRTQRSNGSRKRVETKTPERIELSPLPCWDGRPNHATQAEIRRMVRAIEDRMHGKPTLGVQAICAAQPFDAPENEEPSATRPRFHAIKPSIRRKLESGYRQIVQAYRDAARRLKLGQQAQFPCGCFKPPGLFEPLRP